MPRTLVTSAYNERREDCERAVAAVRLREPSVRALRDVDLAMLARATDLDPLAAMRARHIIEENERVLLTVDALASDDLAAVGELFAASHASLRDLFQVSCPELDVLVELAVCDAGCRRRADDRGRFRRLHRGPCPARRGRGPVGAYRARVPGQDGPNAQAVAGPRRGGRG